jgi:hypothetical protein
MRIGLGQFTVLLERSPSSAGAEAAQRLGGSYGFESHVMLLAKSGCGMTIENRFVPGRGATCKEIACFLFEPAVSAALDETKSRSEQDKLTDQLFCLPAPGRSEFGAKAKTNGGP